MPTTDFLTTPEMAETLRTTEAALLTLRHRGHAPPAIKVGRKLLWPVAGYRAWVDCRTEQGAA